MVLKKYLLLITLFTFILNSSCISCWAHETQDDEERGTSSPTQRLILEKERKTSYGSSAAHYQINNDEKDGLNCWGACCGVLVVGGAIGFLIYLLAHLKFSH